MREKGKRSSRRCDQKGKGAWQVREWLWLLLLRDTENIGRF